MAAHLEEQQELDNFKHFWKSWGKWLFGLLVVAALGYLGFVLYQDHITSKNQEAAGVLAKMVEKAQNKGDSKGIADDLRNLQQNYTGTIAAAQGTLMAAATEFDHGNYDVAAGHLQWVLNNQKAPLVQVLAAQRLAVVQLQQKKYADALKTVDMPVEQEYQPLLLETKGDIYSAESKNKEAVAAYEQALTKMPKEYSGRELVQLKADQLK